MEFVISSLIVDEKLNEDEKEKLNSREMGLLKIEQRRSEIDSLFRHKKKNSMHS